MSARKHGSLHGVHGSRWSNALFVLPFLCLFVGLIVYPLFDGIWLGLHKADFFGERQFIGLENFSRLFSDRLFLKTVANTLYFVLLTVPSMTLIGLGLALALNRTTRTAAILRGIFFSSIVLSVTIVTLLWRIVFIPDGGLLANLYGLFNLEPVAWLNSEALAMPSIAVTTIWWGLGLPMILFLAALQQIPRELYEAAALDNANRWQTLTRVTLPSIRRTFVLVIIIQIVLQFQLFGQSQLMTQGGPNNASRSIVLFVYETGFNRWDIGYATAASQILFLLILIAAMTQYLVARRAREET